MAGLRSILLSTGLIALASAFTPPNFNNQTFGALLLPDLNDPVTQGQTFQVKWDTSKAVAGETVSLVLCNGPGSNCVLQSSAIASGLDATSGSYSWAVPCTLPVGTENTATGYGMLIIVDGSGQFQYSTQFSVLASSSCGGSTTTTTSSSSSSSITSTSSQPTSSSTTPHTPGWNSWNGTSSSTASPQTTTAAPVWTTATATSASAVSASWVTSASPSSFTGAAVKNVMNSFGAVAVGAAALFAL